MDQDTWKIKQLLIVALVLFMIASILGIVILFQPDEDRFQYYLNQTDSYIESGRLPDVPAILMKASRYADSRIQWFSLFKRSYIVCEQTGDYTTFNDLLDRSRKFIKAGPEHDALFTASLLWTDQYERAAASLYALEQSGFETLAAESLLSFEVYRNYSLKDQQPLDFIKEKISQQEDPEFFHIIGTLADNDALLYNAVLLYLEDNRLQDAEMVLNKLSSNRIPPYRMGVIYHDLGQYRQALKYYQAQDVVDEIKENQRFSMKQQIGDLQYRLGMEDKALASYEKGIALHNEGSWKLYRNVARIYYDKGYSRKARLILEEGLLHFPDQIELLSDYISFFREDYSLIVKKKLESYINRFPEDMDARLLKLRHFPDPMNPTQYQAQLWEYFNNSENSEGVSRFLLWYLAGLGDSKSIRIVLNRYEYEGDKPHWYIFYEGMLSFLEQDLDMALEKMEEAYALYPSWLYERNMSLLNNILGYPDMAMLQLQTAITSLEEGKTLLNRDELLSDMYRNLGEMYLDQDAFEKAATSLETSVRYDSDNHTARSLLNRIK